MNMFCYQCQETAKGTGCTLRGVCGKTAQVSNLQDLLIYTVKGISEVVVKGGLDVKELGDVNHEVLNSLFITITNANFDDDAIEGQIKKMLAERDKLRAKVTAENLHDCATFEVGDRQSMLEKAVNVGILSTENEDIRSLREMITYGIKGLAAYAHHALNIGKENPDLYVIYEAMAATG